MSAAPWTPPAVSPRLARAVRAIACLSGLDVGDLDDPRPATEQEWAHAAAAWPALRAELTPRST